MYLEKISTPTYQPFVRSEYHSLVCDALNHPFCIHNVHVVIENYPFTEIYNWMQDLVDGYYVSKTIAYNVCIYSAL
jgi:hypothetical protein